MTKKLGKRWHSQNGLDNSGPFNHLLLSQTEPDEKQFELHKDAGGAGYIQRVQSAQFNSSILVER